MRPVKERAKTDIAAVAEVDRRIRAAFEAYRDLLTLQDRRVRVAARYDTRLRVLGGALRAEAAESLRIFIGRNRWERRISRARARGTGSRIPGAVHPVFGPVTPQLLEEQAGIRQAIGKLELLAKFEAEKEMIEPGLRREVRETTSRLDRMLVRWAMAPGEEEEPSLAWRGAATA